MNNIIRHHVVIGLIIGIIISILLWFTKFVQLDPPEKLFSCLWTIIFIAIIYITIVFIILIIKEKLKKR